MKKFTAFVIILLILTGSSIYAGDLPVDSETLLGKFSAYEEKELRDAETRIAEKKALVIDALKTHFKRESKAGNRDSALAILSKIEDLAGGKREFTQGLDKMVPFAGNTSKKKLGASDVPDGAVRVGSSYFLLFTDRVTRSEAAARCEKMGGRLAVITTDRIYENYVDEARRKYDFNASWTAGRYHKASKKWVWDNDGGRFNAKFLQNNADVVKPQYEFLVMDVTTGKLFPKPDDHKQCFLCEWPR